VEVMGRRKVPQDREMEREISERLGRREKKRGIKILISDFSFTVAKQVLQV
jgi:hypothetical protein